MCVYEVCVTCVRGVCVCEGCVSCEDTHKSFAAMLCMGYYKFGEWGGKATSFPGGNHFPVHDHFNTGKDSERLTVFTLSQGVFEVFHVC